MGSCGVNVHKQGRANIAKCVASLVSNNTTQEYNMDKNAQISKP